MGRGQRHRLFDDLHRCGREGGAGSHRARRADRECCLCGFPVPARARQAVEFHLDGLWGIGFGNDRNSGPSTVLYFAAGPDDETNGLFGKIEFVPR